MEKKGPGRPIGRVLENVKRTPWDYYSRKRNPFSKPTKWVGEFTADHSKLILLPGYNKVYAKWVEILPNPSFWKDFLPWVWTMVQRNPGKTNAPTKTTNPLKKDIAKLNDLRDALVNAMDVLEELNTSQCAETLLKEVTIYIGAFGLTGKGYDSTGGWKEMRNLLYGFFVMISDEKKGKDKIRDLAKDLLLLDNTKCSEDKVDQMHQHLKRLRNRYLDKITSYIG